MIRRVRNLSIAALALLLPFSAIGQTPSGSKRLAVVNGEIITEEQVQKTAAGELDNLDLRHSQAEATFARDRQNVIEKTLNDLIDERVIAAEAAKRGVAPQTMMATEVESKVVRPDDKEVQAFYDANKARINVTGDEALRQVREYLTDNRREAIYDEFMTKLRASYNVESFLEPLRVPVATKGFPSKGPETAPVTIVEFSDFECPFCGALFPTMKQIEANYGDRIRVVFRQFPLTNLHPHAQKAAEASLCANDQQKFWELHDAMFKDNKNLDLDGLRQKASTLQLDMAAFNSCLDSAKHLDAVRNDIREGVKVGVSGTPAMFINGRFLNGAQPYGEISKIIDEELKKNQAKQ